MSNLQSGTIGRSVVSAKKTVADKRAIQYFGCGFEDCRQGLGCARIKGGDELDKSLTFIIYLPI